MTPTRWGVVAGVVVLGLLCWLAAIGVTVLVGPLVTVFVLVLLVAGGNLLSGRGSPRGSGGSQPGGSQPGGSQPGGSQPGGSQPGGGQ